MVEIENIEEGTSFLFIAGLPLDEPVAWWGPVVMNTDKEIQQVQNELRDGTFPGS